MTSRVHELILEPEPAAREVPVTRDLHHLARPPVVARLTKENQHCVLRLNYCSLGDRLFSSAARSALSATSRSTTGLMSQARFSRCDTCATLSGRSAVSSRFLQFPSMDAPDRPLSASQEVLSVIAAWARSFEPQMRVLAVDRAQPPHRVAQAANLLRLHNLCDAVHLLNDAALYDEAATLVRVIAELAIGAAWIGTNDERAWDHAYDLADSAARGDELRRQHLKLEPLHEPLDEAKRLVNLRARAEQGGQDTMALFSGVYDILSAPSHNGTSILAHLDADERDLFGRATAGIAVQAATRLVRYVAKNLEITKGLGEIDAAMAKWTASRIQHGK